MQEIVVSATEARKNFFNLLDRAASGKAKVVVVKRDSGQAVTLVPVKREVKPWSEQRKDIEATFGIWRGKDNDWERKKKAGRKAWLKKLKKLEWI